jgi:hypothetical protein
MGTPRRTARIGRTVDNMLVCRTVRRSVLSSVTGRRRRAATVCHRGYRPRIDRPSPAHLLRDYQSQGADAGFEATRTRPREATGVSKRLLYEAHEFLTLTLGELIRETFLHLEFNQ